MKKQPIKLKITLWFTLFMTLSVVVCLFFLFSVGEKAMINNSRNQLISTVSDSLKEIEYDDGELDIDEDLDAYQNGIYLSVYDSKDSLIFGSVPHGFPFNAAVRTGEITTITDKEQSWYVYEQAHNISGYGSILVRGVVGTEDTGGAFSILLRLAIIALPFLVAIAATGGYLIVCHAFRPVKHIALTARQIGESKDLSKRINLGKGKDEIYDLANTFDSMFDRLERAFESEKQFTSDASHELRTPVSVIISQCEYSLKNAQTIEEAKEGLDKVLTQAQKMSGLISQLLTLARTDKNHHKLHFELLNLSELTQIICEQQQEKAALKNITIQTQIEPDLLIRGDETMLMRLFINLIDNGIQYGRADGHLIVTLKARNRHLIGKVQDDGIGIAPEHLSKVWERFYQVDPSRNPNTGSCGLGLSMVKWIVEAHGGTIGLQSSPGEGSIFTFALPIYENSNSY